MTIRLLHSPVFHLFARVYFAIKRSHTLAIPAVRILTTIIGKKPLNIILADDDEDDRELFMEAMQEIAPQVKVTLCEDGNKLMNYLFNKNTPLPDLIFLDLNMPLKNGNQCLKDIRSNEAMKGIPVIIYSTSQNQDHIDKTFLSGANFYFPKANSFSDTKAIMERIMNFSWTAFMKPQKNNFVLSLNKAE
jgi:PleD family two-component response regulator